MSTFEQIVAAVYKRKPYDMAKMTPIHNAAQEALAHSFNLRQPTDDVGSEDGKYDAKAVIDELQDVARRYAEVEDKDSVAWCGKVLIRVVGSLTPEQQADFPHLADTSLDEVMASLSAHNAS